MVFDLLKAGFATSCFDGQNFFDTDHPVVQADGSTALVSNMQAGTDPAWYLLDTSREVRPIIFQERIPYEFQSLTASDNTEVFVHDRYLYGMRARVNVGFGLWQLGYGSQAALAGANYAAARAAMMGFRSDGGKILGVNPTVLVVPPALERDARYLLAAENEASGASNPWKASAELIVSAYLA